MAITKATIIGKIVIATTIATIVIIMAIAVSG